MNIDDIVEDPLYQLNLTLWLLQPQRGRYPFKPLLREAGYELFAIGPSMPLGPELREMITSESVGSTVEPEPDLLLSRNGQSEFVVWECKSHLFGADSSNARQARGLLLQTGEQFNLATGLELNATPNIHLIYFSKHVSCREYLGSVCGIKHDLELKGMKALPVGGVGIGNRNTEVRLYDAYSQGTLPPAIASAVGSEITVQILAEDESPIPLFLIPWDPNVSQSAEMKDHCESVFRERILSALVTTIGPISTPATVEVVFDDLLNKATFGIYEQWRSKETRRALRRSCRRLVANALGSAEGRFEQEELVQPGRGFSLRIETADDLECILGSIAKCHREAWIDMEPDPQLILFPENDGA